MGDASEDLYFPEHLMDTSEVVVVTLNYRVGPFGFLCLGTEEVPGNMVNIGPFISAKKVSLYFSALFCVLANILRLPVNSPLFTLTNVLFVSLMFFLMYFLSQ